MRLGAALLAADLTDDALGAWLQFAAVPMGARTANALLGAFGGDPRAALDASDAALAAIDGVSPQATVRLRDPRNAPTPRVLDWARKSGMALAPQGDPLYPERLREIPDAPAVLFLRGNGAALSGAPAAALVGSRAATPYGRATADRLARDLSAAGVRVLSGGAVGIDAAAHRAAVDAGGVTVAVLGCGLDVNYPAEHRGLFQQIAEHGALVTECAPGAAPDAWRFPLRNRIISALSDVVVVVEAGDQSGALITARYAADHGRTVLAVPGNIDRASSRGTNALIRDGAGIVTGADDVLDALGVRRRPAAAQQMRLSVDAPRPIPADVTDAQRSLLEAMDGQPLHFDALAAKADVDPVRAAGELTLLELRGLATRQAGNVWVRGGAS